MKLSEYLEAMQELIKDRPELMEAEVIYAADEDGDSFHPCQFSMTAGQFDGEYIEESGDDFEDEMKVNCVCLN